MVFQPKKYRETCKFGTERYCKHILTLLHSVVNPVDKPIQMLQYWLYQEYCCWLYLQCSLTGGSTAVFTKTLAVPRWWSRMWSLVANLILTMCYELQPRFVRCAWAHRKTYCPRREKKILSCLLLLGFARKTPLPCRQLGNTQLPCSQLWHEWQAAAFTHCSPHVRLGDGALLAGVVDASYHRAVWKAVNVSCVVKHEQWCWRYKY